MTGLIENISSNARTAAIPSSGLYLGYIGHHAALYACKHYHYSASMPSGKVLRVGVWEDGAFIGAVVFGQGIQQFLGRMFGCSMQECCELCRVALRKHVSPVSRIVSIALRLLKRQCPELRVVVSYADCDRDHHGGIYIAGNWTYVGLTQQGGGTPRFRLFGEVVHPRTIGSRKWKQSIGWLKEHIDPLAEEVYTKGKHKYAYPLTNEMREKLEQLKVEPPKRAGSSDSGTLGHPAERGRCESDLGAIS